MNKIYRIIWSKAKNCYVVVSELAKSNRKSSKGCKFNRILEAGVLACIISGSISLPAEAMVSNGTYNFYTIYSTASDNGGGQTIRNYGLAYNPSNNTLYTASYWYDSSSPEPAYWGNVQLDGPIAVGGSVTRDQIISALGYIPIATDTNTTYGAGNGLTLSGTTFSAKGGTGIAVDSNGINIIAGSVANGNVNAITGDTAYSELRPANGTFVKSNQTTATNLTALDTASKNAIKGLSTNGSVLTYTKGDGTTDTISTFAKYVGINSSDGTNQTGEGAVAADSITVGKNAKATKKNSVAIGLDSYADEENTISVGHSKTKFDENDVPIDPDTNQPYADPSSVTVFDSDLTRRITNVANGIHFNDAVNYGQLLSIQGGAVVENNTKLISGGTVYTELRPADGQFIRRTNTTAQNLTALDTMGKNAVKSLTVDGNMLVYTRGDNTSVSVDLPTNGGSGSGPISRYTGEGITTTVGSVTAFASNSTPTGYLLCDGRAVSRTKYANLFKKIGTTYGAGDGSTTFNLPNLVGRFIEGNNSSGRYVSAGLPNITGQFGVDDRGTWVGVNGAFYLSYLDGACGSDGDGYGYAIGFDANRSNSIYGSSNTVQPESLMMQYYIKTDDEFGGSRYMGVNTVSGYFNEFGEGATGTDATAIGRNASAIGTASVALGRDTVASGNGVVSVGHLATDINPATNAAYGSELNRKIINVADGTSAHDVATYGQMNIADTALSNRIGVQAEDGNYIKKSETNDVVTNIALLDGKLGKSNALNGNYTEATRSITSNIKSLDTKIGSANSAVGWYTTAENTVNANIKALDTQIKAVETSIGVVDSNKNYIIPNVPVSQNLINLDGSLKTVSDDLADEVVNRTNADTVLGNRIGTLISDGYYIKNSDTNNVSQNIWELDKQLKTTDDSSLKDLIYSENVLTVTKGDGSTSSFIIPDTTYNSMTLDKVTEGSDTTNNTISAKVLNDFVTNKVSVETSNRIDADNVLDSRIGTIVANGNYIKKSDVNNLSTNLILLDNELKNTNTNIEGFARDITRNKESIRSLNTSVSSALGSVSSTSSLVTTLDNTKADASLNNLTATGKQVITNAAINAVQEYIASQQNIAIPSAPMMYSNNPNTLSVTNAGNGSLHVGEGSYVNGTSSIAIGVGNQVNANNAGAFGDPSVINADESYVLGNDDTINTGAIGSFIIGNDSTSNAKGSLLFGSNIESKNTAENSVALGNNTMVSGKSSVALGNKSTATEDNVVSVGTDSFKRKIVNVADGDISENSTDVVTGRQLFQVNENLVSKANSDASNIDTVAWAKKLGTGQIRESDSNLVTGGTVYDALSSIGQNIPVQATDEAIFIGANRTDNMISVLNQNGEGRVISGVITNMEDDTSVANVGYVKAVGESMLNAVNNSIGQLDTKVNKVGANAAAMASLTPASFEGDEKWSLSAGVGNYRGETAGAVGAFYRPAENVLMNVRGSFGNNENMVGAAVSVSLSKGDVPGVTKRQLATKVNQLENVVSMQNKQIAEMRVMMEEMRQQMNNK